MRKNDKLEHFDSTHLVKWLAWIFLVGLAVLVTVVGAYWVFFDGQIIPDHERWGTFGDYVGGVLNPFFSFLALLALLLTIVLQNRQLDVSRRELIASRTELELTREELARSAAAAQSQVEHFEGESKRADIQRLIEKLSERINRNYNENRLDNALSLHRVMRGGRENNSDLTDMLYFYKDKQSPTYATVRWLESDLERLSTYIDQYETVSRYGGTPIPAFYREEFGELVMVLYEFKMLNEALFSYYCRRAAPNTRLETDAP